MKLDIKHFFLLVLFGFYAFTSWSQINDDKLNNFDLFIAKSKRNKDFSIDNRLSYALQAKKIVTTLSIDSLILKSNINISEIYLEGGYENLFLKLSKENLEFSNKIKDSFTTAFILRRLGKFYNTKIPDSAYYFYNKSEKLYRVLGDNFNTAKLLLDIAVIQKNERDFTGSELTSIEGVKLLESLTPNKDVIKAKTYLFNNLGMVFDQLGQFNESIKYHKQAIELKSKLKGNKATLDNSKNNLALAYKNNGDYNLAFNYYSKILENNNLINERAGFYALVLDSYAHTKYLLNRRDKLPGLYFKALKICDSLKTLNPESEYNIISISQHLAEYYNGINKKDSAKYYGYKAKNIAEKYHKDDLLKSLLLLSEIEEEEDKALKNLKAYIKLNDSLQKNERSIRNKFARIHFETQQIEKENVQITKERTWLFIIALVLVLALVLLYLVISQRNKNKELQFIQEQQKSNEEIYNLMLSQNEKVEEARTLEKKRISEDLHDGVLGRLFGTRLSLDSLNNANTEAAIQTRSQYIDELKIIEQDIRKVSHELNTDFISGSGFIDIIRTLVETQTLVYKLDSKLEHDDLISWDEVSNKKKINIYRIIQELLHNVYKHASATKVGISFKLKDNLLCFKMTDDGLGFDVNKAKSGIGLKNMNSRIKTIDGVMDIESTKGEGTIVSLEVPIR